MASAGSTLQAQALSLQQRIRTFTNNDLKEVCRSEHLPVSGTKAVLQKRISDHMNMMVMSNGHEEFTRIRSRVYEIAGGGPPPTPAYTSQPSTSTSIPSYPSSNGLVRPSQVPAAATPARPGFTSRLIFKDSPFVTLQQLLGQPLSLASAPGGKGSASAQILLSPEVVARLKLHPDLKVFLYAAPDSSIGSYSRTDIAFPQHIEVRVNGDEIRHNWKGLKNKPGSTKPADITDKMRKMEGFKNGILVTYAYTDKKWIFEVHLAKTHTVEELAKRIELRGLINREKVIRDMRKRADDPDVMATSSVMSLKDPISTQRITLPCRSTVCSHNSCFDATQFLYLQEQAPTWTCPLCNKSVSYEALVIDQYVQDILKSTARSIDQVTIEPDGKWSTGVSTETPKTNGKAPRAFDDDSDDDLVETSGLSGPPIKNELLERPSNALLSSTTPPVSGRTSIAPGSGTPRSGGTKRKSEVIDLTMSSDDDEPPPKRRFPMATNGHASSFTNGNGRSSHQTNSHAHSRPSSNANGMPFRVPPMSNSPSQVPSFNHSSGSSSSGYLNSTFTAWR